jgi:hypothetical protein
MINDFRNGETKLFFILQEKLELATIHFKKEHHSQNEQYALFKNSIDYKAFSDCICISIPTHIDGLHFLQIVKSFLSVISAFQMAMLELDDKCYFIRGGISVGQYYHDDNMIFSPALIEAYELENKKAIVPRILIAEQLHQIIGAQLNQWSLSQSSYPLIIKFEDDLPFLNFLNAELFDAYIADKEIENFQNRIGVQGMMIGDSFVENGLKSKVQRINEISKKIIVRLSNKNYSQEVINKHQWVLRFLDSELADKTAYGF